MPSQKVGSCEMCASRSTRGEGALWRRGVRRESLLRPLPAARLGDLDPGEAGGAGRALSPPPRTIPCNGRARPGWSISSPAASRGRRSRRVSCGASRSRARACRSGSARNAIRSVGDLAETLSLLLPEGGAGEEVSLDRLDAGAPSAAARARRGGALRAAEAWTAELPVDQRLVFFKLITGELRIGVSRLQVVKALAEVAGVEESRMAQRMIGYAQARRAPSADDF